MIDNSFFASSMPRLPVSWREFSELLRTLTSVAARDRKDKELEAVERSRLDIRSDEPSNRQDQHRFSSPHLGNQGQSVNPSYEGDPNPSDSPTVDVNSSASDYPNGFEAFA